MKKHTWSWVFVLFVLLSWNVAAWADFYVIPAGARAKRTVLVSPENTPTQSGQALLNALAGITDASVTNPYLIIIEPGVYDIGSSSLQMKSYVDIQGSGEIVTKITGNVSTSSWETEKGVLEGADNSELRFLTVEHAGGGMYTNAIYNDGTSPKMTHVTARCLGGTYCRAVHNSSSSATMTDVTAEATGGHSCTGIHNDASSPTMTNVTATASGTSGKFAVNNRNGSSTTMKNLTATASVGAFSYGVYNDTSTVKIDHSTISGSTYAVYGGGTGLSKTYIANTRLEGTTGTTGLLTCAGVYDGNYNFYASSCP